MQAEFLQFLFSGLTVGATYALAALGFTLIYNASNGYLYYDADGTGGAGPIRFARLQEGLKLKASDFYVV